MAIVGISRPITEREVIVATKYVGLVFVVGIVLVMLGSAFFPGAWFVNPVDQTDFREAVLAIGEAPNLAHGMTFLMILGVLLQMYGLLSVYGVAVQQRGVSGHFLRLGIIIALIEWVALILATAIRHLITYLMQQSAIAKDAEMQEKLFETAISLQIDVTGISMAYIALFPISTILVGIGLVNRMPSMNIYKMASYALVMCGLAGLISYVLLMFGPASEPWTFIKIINILGFVATISVLVLAIGIYREQEGLREQSFDSQNGAQAQGLDSQP